MSEFQVPIIILGLGNVGRALLRQILTTRDVLAQRAGLRLLPTGLADSRAMLFGADGLPDGALEAALQVKTDGRPLSTLPVSQPLNDFLAGRSRPGLRDVLRLRSILVDTTASPQTDSLLQAVLDAGCGVVLANKHPLSGPWAGARAFFEHPCLRYEATVGAGLPVIATLQYLLDTGDSIARIEGCLSGTLGYLCAQFERDVPYSVAVSQARSLGYTEPDPREDLSGRDVARKALILARTAGWSLEMADLTVEPLYPESLAGISTKEFMAATPTLDETYAHRIGEVQARGQVLRYIARVGPEGGKVGLVAVPQHSSLGALRGPASYVAFHTGRYDETALVISGPGAGPEVTAAGVLGDMIDLAMHVASCNTARGERNGHADDEIWRHLSR